LFATGTVNPVVISEDAWEKCWQNIRRVNVFLQNVDSAPLSGKAKTTYKAEARFLRAWYYFILVKHYGGVPLIGDVVYKTEDEIKTERNTFAECIDYILSECDLSASSLTTVRPAGYDYGRIGSGACMGLKSRVLLYVASPLFNGGAEVPAGYPKELVAYPEYEKTRWEAAMKAAQDVINLNVYALYNNKEEEYPKTNGYFWAFLASNKAAQGAQKELLVEQQVAKGNYRESLFCPPSRGGNGGGYAYQELIDCYPMIDGTPYRYTEADELAGQNPWESRDPRLFQSITYDQHDLNNGGMSSWGPVDIYLRENGTPSGQDAVYTGTPTGYYICKMQFFYQAAGNFWNGVNQSRPQLRYAEILLNYAEAATEWHAPANPPDEVYEALKLIRERAGIQAGSNNMYGLKENMTADEMREVIRNERRIELAFEGHRFFDVRRWMIAPETDSKMMTGMEVRMKANKKVYTRFNVRQHIWRPAMYFWPIPYKEVSKAPDMKQNPFY
ncbi:MAG: RagB/SusD family nutrient uptake outer membrane protein, partial [Dysgonamonadaceae bacterium]|nr:RagB/SusD family nutrient uptake outer membrane protein [Dysgonamonadaceae bacterium]